MRMSHRSQAVKLATLLLALSTWPYVTWGAGPPSTAVTEDADKAAPSGPSPSAPMLALPGPLLPFLRLAAVSHQVTPEEVLPLVSHQVVLDGYGGSNRASAPTEYLILVRRYVDQARELQALADPEGTTASETPRARRGRREPRARGRRRGLRSDRAEWDGRHCRESEPELRSVAER